MTQHAPEWVLLKCQEIAPLLNGMTGDQATVLLLSMLDSIALASGNRVLFWCNVMGSIQETIGLYGPGPEDVIH